MRLLLLAPLALGIAALGGCTCADTVRQTRFACQDSSQCLPDFVCRGGECRSQDIPAGSCEPGEVQACAQGSCTSRCGEDGGFLPCGPADGGSLLTDPGNCGACGRRCSTRLGDALTCVDGRCTCVTDFDCPSGDVCGPGGVCVMSTDPCAKVTCAAGEVCREGACAPIACALGCKVGEVCDPGTATCRLILPCRLAVACGDGGVCEGGVQPDGELCTDGVACSSGDSCQGGACRGTAYSCPAPTACQQSVACDGDGGCTVVPVMDGTSCDDGNACSFGDSCVSGVCTGTAYTCQPDQCAETSVCAGDGGCLTTPRNIGSSCDDGNACSYGDVCNTIGQCAGTTYSCPGMTQCKQAGVCLGDGGCQVVDKADGTMCDDGNACTGNDSCTSGSCAGTPRPSYQDNDGDGIGNLNISQTVCPVPSGYVLDGGDCNDTNAFINDLLPAATDADQDGVTATTTLDPVACVGPNMTVNGRNYYRGASGAYSYLAVASAAADCNDADPDIFQSRPSMVLDTDRDGYAGAAATTACVGASSVINGRTYYANAAGAFVYLDSSAALGATDCSDSNANIFTTLMVARDQDRDGFTATTTTSSQCVGASSVVNTRTYYADSAGAATWSTTASAAADCNDTNATITGTATYYVDGDLDGFGAGTGTARCTPVAGEVLNNTDCNDANASVFNSMNAARDQDRDGFTATTTTSSQCVGASSVVNTRTYYNDTAGAATWLATASTTADCDDNNASITVQRTFYVDGDGDTFGAGAGTLRCAAMSGEVLNNTDCNDANSSVFANRSVAIDTDRDGVTGTTTLSTQCVGNPSTFSGRSYYATVSGIFNLLTTASATADCNDNNANVFTTLNNVVRDDDKDGYPPSVTDVSGVCAGATSTAGGRTYYSTGSGGFWMSRTDCINRQGSNCQAPVDCYDLNAAAIPVALTSFFTTDRGDGSFDYDCSGSVTPNLSGTYCATQVTSTDTFTGDATCTTSTGLATVCTSTGTVSGANGCGKPLVGAATYYNPGTCTAAFLPGASVVGCR